MLDAYAGSNGFLIHTNDVPLHNEVHRLTGVCCPFPIVAIRELCDSELLNKRNHHNQNYPEIAPTTALEPVA
jgi:hypothetical protein